MAKKCRRKNPIGFIFPDDFLNYVTTEVNRFITSAVHDIMKVSALKEEGGTRVRRLGDVKKYPKTTLAAKRQLIRIVCQTLLKRESLEAKSSKMFH